MPSIFSKTVQHNRSNNNNNSERSLFILGLEGAKVTGVKKIEEVSNLFLTHLEKDQPEWYDIIQAALKNKMVKLNHYFTNLNSTIMTMVVGLADHYLQKLAKECNFPRGLPIVWHTTNGIKAVRGFVPKFGNDKMDNNKQLLDLVEGDSFSLKLSGSLGFVFAYIDDNDMLVLCFAAKNSTNNVFTKKHWQLLRKTVKDLHRFANKLADSQMTVCCENIANNLGADHASIPKRSVSVAHSATIPDPNKQGRLLALNAHDSAKVFSDLELDFADRWIIRDVKAWQPIAEELNAMRDDATWSKISKILTQAVEASVLELEAGTFHHDHSDCCEGLIFWHNGQVAFKWKLFLYVLMTMCFRPVCEKPELFNDGFALNQWILEFLDRWVCHEENVPKSRTLIWKVLEQIEINLDKIDPERYLTVVEPIVNEARHSLENGVHIDANEIMLRMFPNINDKIVIIGDNIENLEKFTQKPSLHSRWIGFTSNPSLLQQYLKAGYKADMSQIHTVKQDALRKKLLETVLGFESQVAASSSSSFSSAVPALVKVSQVSTHLPVITPVKNTKLTFVLVQGLLGSGKTEAIKELLKLLEMFEEEVAMSIDADGVRNWWNVPVQSNKGQKKPLSQHVRDALKNKVRIMIFDINACDARQKIENVQKSLAKAKIDLTNIRFVVLKNEAFDKFPIQDQIEFSTQAVMGRESHPSLRASDGEEKVRQAVTDFVGFYTKSFGTDPTNVLPFKTIHRDADGKLAFLPQDLFEAEMQRVLAAILSGDFDIDAATTVATVATTVAPVNKKQQKKAGPQQFRLRLPKSAVHSLIEKEKFPLDPQKEYHITLLFKRPNDSVPNGYLEQFSALKSFEITDIVTEAGWFILVNRAFAQPNGIPFHITVAVPEGKKPVDAGFQAKAQLDQGTLTQLDAPITVEVEYVVL